MNLGKIVLTTREKRKEDKKLVGRKSQGRLNALKRQIFHM